MVVAWSDQGCPDPIFSTANLVVTGQQDSNRRRDDEDGSTTRLMLGSAIGSQMPNAAFSSGVPNR